METGFVVLLLLVVLAIGVCTWRARKKSDRVQGVIYVYYNGQENDPSLLLEYSVPITDIVSRRQVTFDVNVIQ